MRKEKCTCTRKDKKTPVVKVHLVFGTLSARFKKPNSKNILKKI